MVNKHTGDSSCKILVGIQAFVEVESSGFRGFLRKKVLNSERNEKEFSTSVFNIYHHGQNDQLLHRGREIHKQ